MEDANGQIQFSDAPSPLDRASALGRDSIVSEADGGDAKAGPQLDGFYFDEVSNIRVLDTIKNTETCQLRDECKEFVDRIGEFQATVGGLIETVLNLSKAVEAEKLNAIGSRNLLKSVTQQREAEKMQLLSQIVEKQTRLERLRVQQGALTKMQNEQEQMIESFSMRK